MSMHVDHVISDLRFERYLAILAKRRAANQEPETKQVHPKESEMAK